MCRFNLNNTRGGSTIPRRTARIKRHTIQNEHHGITQQRKGAFVPRLFPVSPLAPRESTMALPESNKKEKPPGRWEDATSSRNLAGRLKTNRQPQTRSESFVVFFPRAPYNPESRYSFFPDCTRLLEQIIYSTPVLNAYIPSSRANRK